MGHIFARVVMICYEFMNFNDLAIASIKGSDYRIHFWCMSKNNAF